MLVNHNQQTAHVVEKRTNEWLADFVKRQNDIEQASLKALEESVRHAMEKQQKVVKRYHPNDLVLIGTPSSELAMRSFGTFRNIGPMQVVKLLRDNVHKVKSLIDESLKEYHVERISPFQLRPGADARAEAMKDRNEWIVEKILSHRGTNTRTRKNLQEFLVRWKGFDAADDSWISHAEVIKLEMWPAYKAAHLSN
jgi:hypothetical protein